ncbi:MAG: hypothetical protein GY754_05130 [bacterium]|nr:hypothetical protein [bacterium]
MNLLMIRHIPETDPPQFRVEELSGYTRGKTTELPSPYRFPIAGIPNMPLMQGLRWYLQEFLEYPYYPDTLCTK